MCQCRIRCMTHSSARWGRVEAWDLQTEMQVWHLWRGSAKDQAARVSDCSSVLKKCHPGGWASHSQRCSLGEACKEQVPPPGSVTDQEWPAGSRPRCLWNSNWRLSVHHAPCSGFSWRSERWVSVATRLRKVRGEDLCSVGHHTQRKMARWGIY